VWFSPTLLQGTMLVEKMRWSNFLGLSCATYHGCCTFKYHFLVSVSLVDLLSGLIETQLVIWCQASEHWSAMERWLQERNARLYPESASSDQFKVLGYQWRVMRFNDHTRQSTAKVMTCYRTSGQRSLFLMQQPHVLAVPCEFTCTILHSL
jgi:hypothetical protein